MANGSVTKVVVFTEDGRHIEIRREDIVQMTIVVDKRVELEVFATRALIVDTTIDVLPEFKAHLIRHEKDVNEIP